MALPSPLCWWAFALPEGICPPHVPSPAHELPHPQKQMSPTRQLGQSSLERGDSPGPLAGGDAGGAVLARAELG